MRLHDVPQHRVGDIVLVDIAHVLNGFTTDSLRRALFDRIEAHIRVEAVRDGGGPESSEVTRSRVVGGEGHQGLVQRVDLRIIHICLGQTAQVGYAISQRIRKRIEEAFGWIKKPVGLAKTKLRGRTKVEAVVAFAAAAYNFVRIPKLLTTQAT